MVTLLESLQSEYTYRHNNPEEALTEKCDELDLDANFLSIALPDSPLPYHNKEHMVNVAFDADFIASRENVPISDRRCLFVAGLFHDVNHTGIAKPDTDNIEAVKEFLLARDSLFSGLLNVDIREDIFPIIDGTNTDLYATEPSYLGGLLRDADVLAWAYKDFEELSTALSAEFCVEITVDSTAKFLQSHPLFSSTAKQVLSESGWLSL